MRLHPVPEYINVVNLIHLGLIPGRARGGICGSPSASLDADRTACSVAIVGTVNLALQHVPNRNNLQLHVYVCTVLWCT
jgi:hypothetical protein